MIKAIVFDMGGVLIDLDFERCVAAYHGIGFDSITELLDPCHQKGIYGDLEAGKVSEDEFYAHVLSQSKPGTTRADIDRCFKSFYTGPYAEKGAYLRELKERGYRIFMLSNNNPIMMRVCAPDFEKVGIGLESFFEKTFISCWMKLMKPGKEIFLKSIEETGLQADELLFIDDSPRNTEAARGVGIKAVDYVQGSSLRDAVEAAL